MSGFTGMPASQPAAIVLTLRLVSFPPLSRPRRAVDPAAVNFAPRNRSRLMTM